MTLVRPYCDKYGLVVLELVPQIVDAKQAMLYIEKREMAIVKLKRLIAETCQLLAKTRQLMGEGQGEIVEMLEQNIEFQGSNSSQKKEQNIKFQRSNSSRKKWRKLVFCF